MRLAHWKPLTILGISAVYFGLTVALALPLLGHHRPSEALRLESVDRRQGSVGQPLSIRLKGAGFDADTRFTLVHDSGNQQAIERRIATFSGVRTILRDGSHIYLGTGDRRVWKIDLNQPENQQGASRWSMNGQPTALLKRGETLWIASGQGELIQVAVDGQSRKTRIAGTILSLAPGRDNTLLAAAGRQGLLVLKPGDETNGPDIIGSLDISGSALAVTNRGELAFIGTATAGLQICDLSDPTSPRTLARLNLTGAVQNISLQGSLALIGTSLGLSIVDIADPATPVLLNHLQMGRVNQVLVQGDLAYLATGETGLLQLDLRDPHRPLITGHLSPGEAIHAFALDGERVFLGTQSAELLLADLNRIAEHPAWRPQFYGRTFPVHPTPETAPLSEKVLDEVLTRLRNQFPEKTSITTMIYNADTFYLATSQGLVSLARNGTGRPEVTASGITEISGLGLAGKTLYLYGKIGAEEEDSGISAQNRYGVELFSIDEFAEPRPLTQIPTAHPISKIHIRNNHMYLTLVGQGGQIFDLQDLRHPQQLGSFQLPWPEQTFANSQDFVLKGETLYLANGRAGLQVFDVSDPVNPRRLGALNPPGGHLSRIALHEDRLFVYDYNGDLQLYDITNPHEPWLCGVLDRIASLNTLEVRDHKLLLEPTTYSIIEKALPLVAEKIDLKSSALAEITFPPPVFPGNYFLYAFDNRGRQVLADLIRVEEPQK